MKEFKYLDRFPKPFLEDLANNRVLPFIGAGFSKNAEIPKNKKMLDWDELGKEFANDIPDFKHSTAIDSISAFSHEYSRTILVEKLTKLLLVDSAKPGNTHKAFCDLQFDIVCTTNFEFLLERGYSLVSKYCRPIIEEDQLSISTSVEGVTLIKFHGDLHHPNRLIATEEDYDRFLNTYPMLATYLGNLLISRTALFVGYSLDDSDFRQIWQLISDRLGKMKRQAYVLKVDCPSYEKTRYERRGVKVINLPGNPKDYPKILEEVFKELKEYWSQLALTRPILIDDPALAELSLPDSANNRLCFFSVPVKVLPFYKKYIYPIIIQGGLVPLSADEIITAGDNWMAKVTAIIKKAEVMICDLSSQNTFYELGLALNSEGFGSKILLIREKGGAIPNDLLNLRIIERNQDIFENSDTLVENIDSWVSEILGPLNSKYSDEPKRLLEKKEYRAAVVSVISLLEAQIQKSPNLFRTNSFRKGTLINQLETRINIIVPEQQKEITDWINIRNNIVHSNTNVTPTDAKKIVNGVYEIIRHLERYDS